jgi:hypothetical protein
MPATRFSGPSSGSTFLGTAAFASALAPAATSTPASRALTEPGTRSTTCCSRPCLAEVTRPFFHPALIGLRSSGRRRRGFPVIRDIGRAGQQGAECSKRQLRPWRVDARSARSKRRFRLRSKNAGKGRRRHEWFRCATAGHLNIVTWFTIAIGGAAH